MGNIDLVTFSEEEAAAVVDALSLAPEGVLREALWKVETSLARTRARNARKREDERMCVVTWVLPEDAFGEEA